MMEPIMFKISSAMAKLEVSRATIYRMVARGELVLVRIGARSSRITSDSLARLLPNEKPAK